MRSFNKLLNILMFLILLIGLPVGIFLLQQGTSFFGFAGPTAVPAEVKITNISDNSFTVSWITGKKVKGFVSYGETQNLGNTALDDRDRTEDGARFTHHVTLKNLSPLTNYYLKIGSGSEVYDNNGQVYSQQTAPTTQQTPPLADPVFGKIRTNVGVRPREAIIYLTVVGGTPLSSFTRETGNWLITLNNARNENLDGYIEYMDGSQISIFVQAGPQGTAARTIERRDSTSAIDIIL